MKKILITGGILFAIMPAMALDLTDMYVQEDTGDCSGDAFTTTPVAMQAIYVTESCPAGYYFNVGNNAAIDSTTGQITGASCQPCTDGHYCPSTVNITLGANNSLTSQGETACPAGTYADSERTSLTACDACPAGTYQTQTGQSSCTQARQGYYIADATQVDVECPVGYRNGAAGTGTSEAECEKIVDCSNACSNFNNVITADDNPEDPTKICSASINYPGNSSITDDNGIKKVLYSNRNIDPLCIVNKTCQPGYTTTNMYAWIAAHLGSITSPAVNCSPDGTGTGCVTQDPGITTWNLTGSDIPMNQLHFATQCSATSFDFGNPSSVIATSISNNAGAYCWLKNLDLPNQPWFAFVNYNDPARCASECGDWHEHNPDYMFGSMQNGVFTPSVNSTNVPYLLNGLASVTNGQNGNPTADVCVASEITINWGKDSENQDITTTCTYGESFTTPSTPPTPEAGYKFLGWRISPANNNN